MQSHKFAAIGQDCIKPKLDCNQIAKYENIHFLYSYFALTLMVQAMPGLRFLPSIVALPCSALILQPESQSSYNLNGLCWIVLDCIGL